jgi:hypothetical protein
MPFDFSKFKKNKAKKGTPKKGAGRGEKSYQPKESGIDTSPSNNFKKKIGIR